MSTQKQIDANRLNAQKSTGPRTPEGRAAVRLNGVTHGLTASTLVLEGESASDFQAIFDSLEAEHQPATPTEELLVSQLAMATWRLRRLYHMEAGLLCVGMIDLQGALKHYKELDPGDRLAIVADRDAQGPNTLANLSRLEARIERSFYRALHELQRLRKEREAKLALVSQTPVEQCNALPTKQTTNIQTPAEPEIPPVMNNPRATDSPAAPPCTS